MLQGPPCNHRAGSFGQFCQFIERSLGKIQRRFP